MIFIYTKLKTYMVQNCYFNCDKSSNIRTEPKQFSRARNYQLIYVLKGQISSAIYTKILFLMKSCVLNVFKINNHCQIIINRNF